MGFKLKDFIKETTTVTGNSAAISLDGGVSQYAAFSSFLNDGDTTWWFVRNADGSEWECRESAYVSATDELARSGTLLGSSTGSAVNFSAGTKTVVCGLPASVSARMRTQKRTITGNDSITLADWGKTIFLNSASAVTISFDPAATLTDGFWCEFSNINVGLATLDPNSAEQIDGQTTLRLAAKQTCKVFCDGSAFRTLHLAKRQLLSQTILGSAAAFHSIVFPAGYDNYEIAISELFPVNDNVHFIVSLSTNGGSSYHTTSGNYAFELWNAVGASQGSGYSTTETGFRIATAQDNNAFSGIAGKMQIFPAANGRYQSFLAEISQYQNTNEAAIATVRGWLTVINTAVNAASMGFSAGNIAAGAKFALYGNQES